MDRPKKPIKAPCCDCTDRGARCHSNCDSYKSWKVTVEIWNDYVREAKAIEFVHNFKGKGRKML